MRRLLPLLLLASSAALATPWCVGSPHDQQVLSEALAELWPHSGLTPMTCGDQPQQLGVWYEGEVLVLATPGRSWRGPSGLGWPEQVAWVRSHVRELSLADRGWLPEPVADAASEAVSADVTDDAEGATTPPEVADEPVASEVIDPEVVEVPDDASSAETATSELPLSQPPPARVFGLAPHLVLGVGTINRLGGVASAAHGSVLAGLGWSGSDALGLRLQVDLAELYSDSSGRTGLLNRAAAYAVITHHGELRRPRLGLDTHYGVGGRVDLLAYIEQGMDVGLSPSVGPTVGATLWSQPNRRQRRYGVDVGLDVGLFRIASMGMWPDTGLANPSFLLHIQFAAMVASPWSGRDAKLN